MPAALIPPPMTAAAGQKRGLWAVMPLVLVYYSFLLFPSEVSLSIFGVNLPSYRIALLATAVPSLWIIMKNRGSGGVLAALDYIVIFVGFWMMLSFMMIYGIESGLVRGAGVCIDNVFAYMVARASVTTPKELRYFLLLSLPGLALAAASLAIESLSGRLLVRPFFASIFGSVQAFSGGEVTGSLILEQEYRLGLLRAYGPFSHPILAGSIMVGFLPLMYFSGLRSWPYYVGVAVSLAGFFSLSSAAFLSLLIGIGAIAIYHVKPYFPRISWWTVVSILGLAAWAAHVSTKSGIVYVLARFTLTPATAEYRLLIWRFGSENVAKNPLFGIGYNQWERAVWMVTDSVDAHFLLLAMRHGLIVPVLLLAGTIHTMIKLGLVMPSLNEQDRNFMIGLNITLFGYLIVGQTVNFFGSSTLVFMSMIAFLASMTHWASGEAKAEAQRRLLEVRSRLYAATA